MKKKQIWVAALTIAALALPYGYAEAAAAEVIQAMTAQVTKATSASRQTSSEVTVAGTWATPKLALGQSFTVSTQPTNGGAPFTWAASFPFMLDDGAVVGECVADQATLTCTVKEVPGAYKDKADVKGTWWARARLQDAAVGTNEGTITLNGEVVKTLVWGIKWIATPGTEYTVKDFDTRLNTSVKCAKSDTWDPATTENIIATQVDDNTIKFTAPDGVKTCIVYPPEQMKVPEGQTSVTNHAEINGVKLESTATVRSNGGTDGDGTVKPTPTPTPTTPAPKPSDEPQSAPSPTPTPEPTPDTVKPTPAPTSTHTTEQPKPTPAPTTAPALQQRLAKTGATANGLLLMIGAIMGGAGAGLLILHLLEGRKPEEETAR